MADRPQSRNENSAQEAQVGSPVPMFRAHVMRRCWEESRRPHSTEAVHVGLSWTLPCVPFPSADFTLYPLAGIHHNRENNSF